MKLEIQYLDFSMFYECLMAIHAWRRDEHSFPFRSKPRCGQVDSSLSRRLGCVVCNL